MIDALKLKIDEMTLAYACFEVVFFALLSSNAFDTKVLNESNTHMTTFSSLSFDSSKDTSLTSFNLCGSLSIIKIKKHMHHVNKRYKQD